MDGYGVALEPLQQLIKELTPEGAWLFRPGTIRVHVVPFLHTTSRCAAPAVWAGHCRPQYYECEWGRQQRAPTSLAPPVHLSAAVREIETVTEHLKC
jgi:predicted transglutaminase-like cysteine proteinase